MDIFIGKHFTEVAKSYIRQDLIIEMSQFVIIEKN